MNAMKFDALCRDFDRVQGDTDPATMFTNMPLILVLDTDL